VTLLSDNGLAFTGKHRGWMVELERHLAGLGVTSIASTPHHPQTCGKNERVHQTLQKWLAARPPAENLAALQHLLDEYRTIYNNRRHQSLDGLTPQQRYDARTKATPATGPRRPSGVAGRPVSATGVIAFSGCSIVLGRTWAGRSATVYWQDDRVTVICSRSPETGHRVLTPIATHERRGSPPSRTSSHPRRSGIAGEWQWGSR
jgi:hypothetical protein